MAVISATRTRKRILATLLAPPRGPFRDPPPVTTHSFPFSSLYLRVYAFSTLVPLSLSLVFFLLASRATPRASVCIIYITRGPGVRLHSAAAHTNPFCGAPERERERELRRRVTSTIRPRSRPRPCRAAKIGATRSLVRSLVRSRAWFLCNDTFKRNALTLSSRSTGFADNWMDGLDNDSRTGHVYQTMDPLRGNGRASMVCTTS